jgi:hypothetical protein
VAFPTIPTVADVRILGAVQANTTATRTFPNQSSLTKNAGDLLVAIIVAYQTNGAGGGTFDTWGGSFTEFSDVGATTQMAIGAAHKWSTGSESGAFTVNQAGTVVGHAAMILMSIAGAHASTPPFPGEPIATGTSAAANPGAADPAAWDVEDTLWIVVGGNGETATTGAFDGVTVAPANYTDYFQTGISADVVGGVEGAVAFRQNAVASEDAGTFTVDLSSARNCAMTIAIRPAAGVPGPTFPRHRHRQPYQRGLITTPVRSR